MRQPKYLLFRKTCFCFAVSTTRRHLHLHRIAIKDKQVNLLRQFDKFLFPPLNFGFSLSAISYVTLPFKNLKNESDQVSEKSANVAFKGKEERTHSIVKGELIWRGKLMINRETDYFHRILESIPTYHKYLAIFLGGDKCLSTIQQCVFDPAEMKTMPLREKLNLLKRISCLSVDDFTNYASTEHLKAVVSDVTMSIRQMDKTELQFLSRCLGTMTCRYDLTGFGEIFLGTYYAFIEKVNADMQQFDLETLLVVSDAIMLFKRNVKSHQVRNLKKNDDKISKSKKIIKVIYTILRNECLEVSKLRYHSNQTIVVMMLLCSDCRAMPYNMEQHFKFIKNKLQNVHNLCLEECAIILMGFNKTNNSVKDMPFMRLTMSKFVKSINTADDVTVAVILKAVSKTFDKRIQKKNAEVYSNIKQLPDILGELFQNYTVETMTHSITAFHNFLISSEKLENACVARLMNSDFQNMNFKYLSKLAFVIGNMIPPEQRTYELLEAMGQAVIRAVSLYDPYDAIRTMIGLSHYGMYLEDLMDFCLSPSMQTAAVTKSLKVNVERNLIYLDQSVRLENPGYHGNLLSEEIVRAILEDEVMSWTIKSETRYLSKRDNFLNDVSKVLGKIFDKQSIISDHVMPHFEVKDLLMCFNDDAPEPLQLMEVPHVSKGLLGLTDYQSRLIEQRPNLHWIVFCIHSMNSFYTVIQENGSEVYRLGGQYWVRERQFRKKGYTVVQVKEYEFAAARDKRQYLLDAFNNECINKQIKH